MLDMQRVEELFALYSDLEGNDLNNWKALCKTAAEAVIRRLRAGVEAERHMERLCSAAAGLACSNFLTISSAMGIGSGEEVRVGDISLKSSSSATGNSGADLKAWVMEQVEDLLATDDFVFKAVEVAKL